MSTNRPWRAKANKETSNRSYQIILTIDQDPYPYWEEMYFMHSDRSKGRINNREFREYRTWKHNRRTRWK